MGTGVRTDFLIAQPSAASGVGRLLDLWGVFDAYNVSASECEADARAIFSDWIITGQDLLEAMEKSNVNRVAEARVAAK